jgi:hypothetical protein
MMPAAFRVERWSERQQVLAIIVVAAMAMFLLSYFLLLPQNRRRSKLARDIVKMRTQLEQRNYLMGETALRREHNREQEAGDTIANEWESTAARLGAFEEQRELAKADVHHIDYKVALFDVRTRLLRKSRSAGIGLPHDLGMEDAVTSNEDARRLMLQLRAVEELVDLSLDMKISMVQQIMPLDPIDHRLPTDKPDPKQPTDVFLEEYPVRLEFLGNIDNVYDLLSEILSKEHLFVMRNLRVETPEKEGSPLLRIRTTLGALVFVGTPSELLGGVTTERKKIRIMGH